MPVVIIQVPGKNLSKNGVWSLYSFIQFYFLLGDLKMELESSGKWVQSLRDSLLGHSLSLILFAAKHSICKKNLNIYAETLGADLHGAVVSVTMAEGFLLARHDGAHFTRRTLYNPHSMLSGGSSTIMSTCVRDEKN